MKILLRIPSLWVWIVILVLITGSFWIYKWLVPCRNGLVVVECQFSALYVYLSFFESALVYLGIARFYAFWKKRKTKQPSLWVYLLIGVSTLGLILYGPFSSNAFLLYLSAPFVMINFMVANGAWQDIGRLLLY